MMNWLSRLFGTKPSSAEIAKNRLKVVLSYDRTNLTPELLNTLQEEIVRVISQHIDIDRGRMVVSTQRGDKGDHLVADIPIIGVRHTLPRRESVRSVTVSPNRRRRKDYRRR